MARFNYSGKTASRNSNVINLTGVVSGGGTMDEAEVREIIDDQLLDHNIKGWKFGVNEDDTLGFDITWPKASNELNQLMSNLLNNTISSESVDDDGELYIGGGMTFGAAPMCAVNVNECNGINEENGNNNDNTNVENNLIAENNPNLITSKKKIRKIVITQELE